MITSQNRRYCLLQYKEVVGLPVRECQWHTFRFTGKSTARKQHSPSPAKSSRFISHSRPQPLRLALHQPGNCYRCR